MKIFIFNAMSTHKVVAAIIMLASFQPLFAQKESPEHRIRFGIGGGVGRHIFNVNPSVQNVGNTTLSYLGKPRTDLNGKYTFMDEDGKWKEFKFADVNAEALLRLTIMGRKNSGWYVNAGYLFSRTGYRYEVIPFTFKGLSAKGLNDAVEYYAYQAGVGRYWRNFWFARVTGMYFQKFVIGGQGQTAEVGISKNYTENGTGYILGIIDINERNFALRPEFGFASPDHPIELTASLIVPLAGNSIVTKSAYYKNRQWQSEAITGYSTFAVSLNLKLGFNIFSIKRKQAQSVQQTAPVSTPDSRVENRFSILKKGQLITLNISFDESVATLKDDSYLELNALADYLLFNEQIEIKLSGHTDRIGDEGKNVSLSRERVLAVKNYLSLKGVASHRVEITYHGSAKPAKTNCPPPCPANRRVEMVIKK